MKWHFGWLLILTFAPILGKGEEIVDSSGTVFVTEQTMNESFCEASQLMMEGQSYDELSPCIEYAPLTESICMPDACYGPKTHSWWLDVAFLYWKAFEGGLEFADSFVPLAGDLSNAKAKNVTFDFKPGVRIGVGYLNLACCWDASLYYTYYHTHGHCSASGLLFPSLNYFGSTAGGAAVNVTSAQADWHLNFQYVDLDFGRPIWFKNCFALHPHLGIRGAWIHHKGRVLYAGGPGITTGAFNIGLTSNFSGGGLEAGIGTRYLFTPCWVLFGELGSSLLCGNVNVKQVQNQAGVNQINLNDSFTRLAPSAQAVLGIGWQKQVCWCRCPLLFDLSAAFETQYWWGQNRIQRFTDSENPIHVESHEDLGLLGFTLKAGVFF
jgi:hypothetical protein